MTERLLAAIRWVVIDEELSRAAKLEIPLATLNVRHFPMFPELEPAYQR